MRPSWIGLFLFLLSTTPVKATSYEDPPSACYQDCNTWMQNLLRHFEVQGELPRMESAVYSGECHHSGAGHNPDVAQYAVVMIDQLPNQNYYFSTIFSFFAGFNEFENWDLTTARENMHPYWKEHGNFIFGARSARVEIDSGEGNSSYTYWLRQNPGNGDLYFITYAGIYTKAFCHLHKNQAAHK
jgi:hypothetical protein